MPVKLNSSGGGSVTLTTPSTATDYTATFPAATGSVVLSNTSGTATVTDFYATNVYASGTVQMGSSFKRNRIINGDMRVDQRNAGASATIPNALTYTLDRWQAYGSQSSKFTVQQNAGSVTPPAGFVNYLGVTSSSSYSVLAADEFFIQQKIEGLNVSDFGFGTANAKTITISFWVRSSLTGTFGASIFNSGQTRCYPFLYTISAANTWTQISTTIAGDTTGTWLTSNSLGLGIMFGLGVGSTYGSGTAGAWVGSTVDVPASSVSVVGTNGATWYVTGVQLEVGSVATPYERQIYSEQLAQCQRYYCKTFPIGTAPANNATKTGCLIGGPFLSGTITHAPSVNFIFPVSMRAAPTVTTYNAIAGTSGQWSGNDSSTVLANATVRYANNEAAQIVNSATTTTADWWQIHAVAEIEL